MLFRSTTTLNGSISGNGGLVKTGSGLLALRAANLFSGTVQVNEGVLRLIDVAALGVAGPSSGTVVGDTAAIEFNDPSGITVGGEPLTLSGSGPGGTGALQSVSGSNTWQGDITLAATTSVRVVNDTLRLDGAIRDSGGSQSLIKIEIGRAHV